MGRDDDDKRDRTKKPKAPAPRLGIVPDNSDKLVRGVRCDCDVCKRPGAAEHRRWIEREFEEWLASDALREHPEHYQLPANLEHDVATSWHAYERALRALEARNVLPHRARTTLLGDFERTPAIALLDEWHAMHATSSEGEEEPVAAVIAGGVGTGKTVAACWLALHRLAGWHPAMRFVTAHNLVRMLGDTKERAALFDEDEDEEGVEVLIVDDLGVEHADARFAAAFDELVDARCQRVCGWLVITTNLTATQFEQRYGARVTDRLREFGTWMPLTGKSLRRPRGAR